MKTTGLHGGDFRKYITVTCNAKNLPSFRVSLGGTYVPFIEAVPNVIRFTSPKGKDTGVVTTLKTPRKGLKVSSVTFKENGVKEFDWQLFIPLKYSLTMEDTVASGKNDASRAIDSGKTDTAATAGTKNPPLYSYKLRIFRASEEKETKYGEVIIKTNLPEKPEIRLTGNIEITN